MEPIGIGLYVFIIYYKKGKIRLKPENNSFYLRAYRDKQLPGTALVLIKIDEDYAVSKKEIIAISDYFFQINTSWEGIEILKLPSKMNQNTM